MLFKYMAKMAIRDGWYWVNKLEIGTDFFVTIFCHKCNYC
jgi:hypothetical protein